MLKIMILTDSNGNPRSFPPSETFQLEETYPYMLRKQFKDASFWQLSFGNTTTLSLISQPLSYLSHWNPDIIIVQSGIVDCRPEAFSEFEKAVIEKLSGRLFGRLKRVVYHPDWIRRRQKTRVSHVSFQRTIKKLKMTFPKATIFWLEICAGAQYERSRPGFEALRVEFNKIIQNIYNEGFVPIQQVMIEADGFNHADHMHWNKNGHKAVADILLEKIHSSTKTLKEALHEQ